MDRLVVSAAALMVTAISWGSGAQASTLKFEMQGDDNYTWTMDSDPTPTAALDGGAWGISGVPGAPGDLNFFNASEEGGLDAVFGGSEVFDYTGPQVYAGLESAPHFNVGLFTMVVNVATHAPANETLRISATPVPAALPLFASALGGLGLFGWRRKRTTAA